MRLSLSTSTIQKIVKKNRKPRDKTIVKLAKYYLTIFDSLPMCHPKAMEYCLNNEARIKESIKQTKLFLVNFLENA